MKRLICALVSVVFFCCVLAACSPGETAVQRPEFVSSDAWAKEPESRSILAPLNFLSKDGNHLMTEILQVEVLPGQTDEEAVIKAIINGPQDTRTMSRVLSTSIELVSVEKTGRVLNIELSANYTYYSELEMLKVRAALANTLTSLFDIDYINVYVDGMDPGYLGMPLGAFKPTTLDLSLLCDQIIQEQKRITDDDAYDERRIVTFYIPDASRTLLIADPEEKAIETVSSGETVERNYLRTVIFGLMTGPRADLFGGFNLAVEPIIMPDENNRRTALVILKERPKDEILAYGSLVYTITGFVCNISSVTLAVASDNAAGYEPITHVEGLGEFENGVFTRGDFSSLIGDYVTLYAPHETEYSLVRHTVAVPQSKRSDPAEFIKGLLNARSLPKGTVPPLPEGVGEEDVLSIKLCGSVAVVDLSSNFHARCAELDQREEYLLVYSMVNTLTEIAEITSVQFTFDGFTRQKLNYIDVSGPLFRNFGLIEKTGD
ncbi:MAG: GerMN domain-containing protein [Christensenellales bacterium]|jgi:germination protein M